jgi:urease gamma subunit
MSERITVFQWGYKGWGHATKRLVQSIDAVEEARGHASPMFVDIRFSRSVRAAGFRDRAFENLLGHARYRWMRSLGNAALKERQGKIRIHCEDAAEQLLDLAIDAAKVNSRIIFFCSCPSPDCAKDCHRAKVSKLLIRAARRRGVKLETQEWPGAAITQKVMASLRVTDAELHRVRRNAKTVALSRSQISTELKSLPHGALVELNAPSGRQMISVQPPVLHGGRWRLPLFVQPAEEDDTIDSLWPYIVRFRKDDNLEAHRT